MQKRTGPKTLAELWERIGPIIDLAETLPPCAAELAQASERKEATA